MLNETRFETCLNNNTLSKVFWGRCRIEQAFSLWYFDKESPARSIIHGIKYKNHYRAAKITGKRIAFKLLHHNDHALFDCVIPVPLHPKKLRKRGYNQSALLTIEISRLLKIPNELNVLYRKINHTTQTQKKRFERWENTHELFGCNNSQLITGKHVLLVDDVITTGSTIEACVHTLISSGAKKVSIATIAFTK